MNWNELPFIEKVKTNQKDFGNKVIDIAKLLKTNPSNLMVVMNNESGLKADIKNPTSSASGLIQFMEATAKELGTTTAELRAMSNVKQLDYVYKYLKLYTGKMNSAGEVYLAVFYPLALYRDDNFTFPAWVVNANKIFDINKDSILTKREFKQYVYDKYKKYLTPNNTPTTQPTPTQPQLNWVVRNKKPILITLGTLTILTVLYYGTKSKSVFSR
jgi:hypothetical protein